METDLKIGSSIAFLIYVGLATGGFVFKAFIPSAPYAEFVGLLTGGFTAYLAKRTIAPAMMQKYGNGNASVQEK